MSTTRRHFLGAAGASLAADIMVVLYDHPTQRDAVPPGLTGSLQAAVVSLWDAEGMKLKA
jgi:hypothetical protein